MGDPVSTLFEWLGGDFTRLLPCEAFISLPNLCEMMVSCSTGMTKPAVPAIPGNQLARIVTWSLAGSIYRGEVSPDLGVQGCLAIEVDVEVLGWSLAGANFETCIGVETACDSNLRVF